MRVQLPSGGFAVVSPDVKAKTLKALDQMLRAVAKHIERGRARRGPAAKSNRPAGPHRCEKG